MEVGEALIDCTSAEFEAAWQHLGLASGVGEPLVVHFAGHGVVSRVSRNLFLATSDIQDLGASLHTTAVRVNNLIAAAVDSGRPVLLLLDVCGAGRAVEEERLLNLLARRSQDADPRVWIIGASASDALAFGARFTTAAAQVLHSLADGDLDISRREEYVPFLTLARAIHSRLGSLGTGEGRYDQDVTHSPLALAAPETPPFFRNPGYDSVARADRLPGLHPALRGLAEACTRGVDPLHFGDRVAGGRSAQTVLFSGRTAQLARIQRWITVGARRLLVVTGGPGSGKSALLGVTACLLHPELEAIGDRVAAVVDDFYPRRPATVLAVHARQLTLDQITDSLGRQLRAQRTDGAGSAQQSTAQALRTGSAPGDATAGLLDDLAAAGDVLVVLDALDEAVDPASVLDEFLLPLVTGADTRGCKLLLGTRPWWDVLPALRRYLDAHPQSVLDLDPADADDRRALAADLDGYLRGLLRPRDLDARERVRSIARRLADYTDHGAFLVAAVYAEHLRGTPAAEAAEPPCDVTEVFDLHIATLAATDPWIRPVLDVLGRARGQGIPLDLVHAAALAHHPPGANTPRPQLADTRRVLGKAAFYTRTAADTDQRVLYRYFHQVLADHTASRGDPAVFYEALLSTVPAGEGGALNWTYAHPYLLRHAADHAAEAGPDAVLRLLRSPAFLGAADLERLLPHVLHRFDGGGPLSAYAQIVGHGARRAALLDDRSGQSALLGLTALHLGFDASHLGLEGSGEEFADRRPRALRSTWATSTTPRLASLPVQPRPVVSLDAATIHDPDGVAHEVIATVCADGTVTFWDARTTTSFGQVDMGEDRPVGVCLGGPVDAEVTVLDASFRIWRGGMWNGRLRRTAGAFPPPERQGRTWMTRAVEGRAPGRLHVVWGRAEEEYETRLAELDLGDDDVLVSSSTMGGSPLLRGNSDIGLWPCGGGRLPLDPAADPAEDVPVVAVTNPLMGEIRLYDVEEGTLAGRVPLDGYEAVTHCRTLLCGRLGGAPVAVTGDHMGRISIWSVASYEDGVITYAPIPGHSFTGHFLAVKDLAIATVEGREVLLSGGDDGAVHLWNVRQFRDALRPTPFAGAITGLTVARLPSPDAAGPRDLVLAGDTSGNWSVSDVGSGLRAHAMPPRRQGEVTGVAVAELPVAGTSRLLGVVCSTDQSIRLVDL
ncbi:hypothetical protein, partial [Streptomyces sp. NPDC098101]|uniref:hypothetical protein n=1 Tax=Streptomyces sp. NPDC098101 TaxID=3366096 RepID=UPI003823BE07